MSYTIEKYTQVKQSSIGNTFIILTIAMKIPFVSTLQFLIFFLLDAKLFCVT